MALKKFLSGITILALTGIILLLLAGSASAVTVINSCGFNANIPNEHYVLGSNLTCNGTEHGIIIGANGVVIDGYNETDGQYYWIDGSSPALCDPFIDWSGISDASGYDDVTIKNLEILHFCNGVYLRSGALNEYYTIEKCIIHDIGTGSGTHGIILNTVRNSTVKGCEIYNVTGTGSGCGSGGNGITLWGTSGSHGYARNNTIIDNDIHNNRKAAILTKAAPDRNTISYNKIYENGESGAGKTGGIILRCKASYNNTIMYNDISDNIGNGIYLGGGKNNVVWNTVTANKNSTDNSVKGIGLCAERCDDPGWGPQNNTIYNNTFCENEYVDIYVASVCTLHINGDDNTGDTTVNYDDAGTTGCTWTCGPDLVIEDIKVVRWCCCCIELRKDSGEKIPILFVNDPELAKVLGKDKLLDEVAKALDEDPKLAEEIANKLVGDDKKLAEKLSSEPKLLVERCCCRCNAIKELADLLDSELTVQMQHEMSDLLNEIVGSGCCCCDCCLSADCCCCRCGYLVIYKIANNGGYERAGWSLSKLTVDDHVRSVDIVRPLDARESRWERFCCYRMPLWSIPHEVEVCADETDWVVETNETNNCLTELLP